MEFTEMLDDIYNQLQTVKSEHIILPVPKLTKDTTSITWENIKEFLKLTKTDPKHLYDFIKTPPDFIPNKIKKSTTQAVFYMNHVHHEICF